MRIIELRSPQSQHISDVGKPIMPAHKNKHKRLRLLTQADRLPRPVSRQAPFKARRVRRDPPPRDLRAWVAASRLFTAQPLHRVLKSDPYPGHHIVSGLCRLSLLANARLIPQRLRKMTPPNSNASAVQTRIRAPLTASTPFINASGICH